VPWTGAGAGFAATGTTGAAAGFAAGTAAAGFAAGTAGAGFATTGAASAGAGVAAGTGDACDAGVGTVVAGGTVNALCCATSWALATPWIPTTIPKKARIESRPVTARALRAG
jgi:hypothetical protein